MPEAEQGQEENRSGKCCLIESGSLTLGNAKVLHNINLCFSPGEIVLVTGHNGAGKTSLLRVIGGELTLSSGSLTWESNHPRTVLISDAPWLYDVLTVREHLDFFAKMWGKSINIDAVLQEHRLQEHRDTYGADLSLGLKQRLLFALACLGNPTMLLLDEPFNGLDRQTTAELVARIKNLAKNGCCIIIVSHHHETMEKTFTREITLAHGSIEHDNLAGHENTLPTKTALEGIQN